MHRWVRSVRTSFPIRVTACERRATCFELFVSSREFRRKLVDAARKAGLLDVASRPRINRNIWPRPTTKKLLDVAPAWTGLKTAGHGVAGFTDAAGGVIRRA